MKKVLFGMLLLLVMVHFIYGNTNKEYIQWWINTYGDYANAEGKKDWRVHEAFNVFERVSNVAEKLGPNTPRVFIINSQGEPYALSLPDGGIIVSKKTLDICYSDGDVKKGNQRMAFILGHELAHLANKDFMHMEAFKTLQQYGSEKAGKMIARHFNLSDREKARECRLKELMADKEGVLYASMAGYDTGELFSKDNDFFSFWANQTGISNFYDADSQHPSLQSRLEFIRSQLKSVVEGVELFRAGVLLYQKGSYSDAAGIFTEFSKMYPAREVFNNIGACHFSIALKRLSMINEEFYYRFRISTTIDYTTSAEDITTKGGTRGGKQYLKDSIFARRIKNAYEFFNAAVNRDSQNNTSRYNLSAALICKDEYAAAQAQCDHILRTNPNDVDALNNKAIAFFYYGKDVDLDTTQKSIQLLYKARTLSPNNFEVLYNLASLKEERDRMAGAKQYWEKYLSLSPPKDVFYYYICRKLKRNCSSNTQKQSNFPVIPGEIEIGDELQDVEKKLGKAKIIRCKVGSDIKDEYQVEKEYLLVDVKVIPKDNWRVLLLDDMVEMIEQSLDSEKSVREIIKKYGSPGHIVRHTAGNFYVYKDSGFSFKEINGKVCSFIWFESYN